LVTVIVLPLPSANELDDLFICDDNNDGIWLFDFADIQTQLLSGQDPTEFTLSFHLTQEEADSNTAALSLPYQNTNSTEEIFIRIENNNNSNCFDTTSFELNVFDTPLPTENIEYKLCDYTNPGDLTEEFDVLSFNADLANGQDVTITHYTSLEDAENGVNTITGPYANTSPSQTIYALMTNNAYVGCTSISTYTITVDPLPNLITDVPLVQCDIDNVQDGISLYNLQQAAENIIVGDDPENYTLSFHLSQEDLEANINAIADPTNFVNTSPLQTIFTRVENIATTCYSTSYFYLETIFNPIPDDAGLVVCDNSEMNGNDYDGLGLFTLSDANDYILSLIVANPDNDITNTSQLDIVYYFSESDALLEVNPLPNQYTSEVPNSQTVYIRIERGNDCFGINTMLLQVVPVPELNEVPDDILCTDTPGVADVVLTNYDTFVLGSQAATDVIISYHATQEDADAGVNPLTSPYTVNNEQTIFVREEIQNNTPSIAGCYITNVNFTLTVEQNPQVTIPDPVFVCDDDSDGFQTFDLTGVDADIIGSQTAMIVSYYTNQNDADSATNPIGTTFDNTIPNAQTLTFRIESLVTGCYSTGDLELIVNSLPIIPPLDNFITCDDNVETDTNPTNDSVEFDLQTQNTTILNGQDPVIFQVSYYATANDAQLGTNPLPAQFTNTTNPQTIFTRVENTITDCFNTAPLVLSIDPLPVVTLEEDYLLCINTNGTEILTPLVIYSNLSPTDYTFIWSNASGDVLETGPNFEPTQGGVYTLEVFDTQLPTQCGSPPEIFTVLESSPPEATAEVTSQPFASTHIIQSIATGQGVYEFSLDEGPWVDSGLFVGVAPGEHIVGVRDVNGCGIQEIPVVVFGYPKFFTPNQDGYNDLWNINSFSSQSNAKIYIFDRYGKLLKQISPENRGWDGTYNGTPMPASDYWFLFQYNDLDTGNIKELTGHFALKR
jgi:gliding motility-associated-like protein